MRPLVLVLLVAMLAYTLWKKDFGALHRPQDIGRRELVIALAIGAAIGFYDGFFGPGTGSFLIFLFVRFFGLDFLRASAASKVVNGDERGGDLVLRTDRQHPVAVRAADGGGQHHRFGGGHAVGAEGRHAVHPQIVRGPGGGADRADGVGYVPQCVTRLPASGRHHHYRGS